MYSAMHLIKNHDADIGLYLIEGKNEKGWVPLFVYDTKEEAIDFLQYKHKTKNIPVFDEDNNPL